METMETIRVFLGWCTAINLGLLMLAALILVGATRPIAKLHAGLLGMDEADLPGIYMRFLGQYKTGIIILNLVPYIALRIMA